MTGSLVTFVTDKILPSIGWGSFIAFLVWAWRAGIKWNKNHEAAQKAMAQVNEWSVNHMPHIQEGIEQLNEKTDDANKILTNIDKGIAILTDRGRV